MPPKPAGEYTVVPDSGNISLRLRNTISGNGFFVSGEGAAAKPLLTFTRSVLRYITRHGATFHIPLTRRDSESAKATPAETVAVKVAE